MSCCRCMSINSLSCVGMFLMRSPNLSSWSRSVFWETVKLSRMLLSVLNTLLRVASICSSRIANDLLSPFAENAISIRFNTRVLYCWIAVADASSDRLGLNGIRE